MLVGNQSMLTTEEYKLKKNREMLPWEMQSSDSASDGGSLKTSPEKLTLIWNHTVILGDTLNVIVSCYTMTAHFKNNTLLFSWS